MKSEQPDFELSAPPSHLMDLETAARSFGVTRQSFHRWNVRPVRIEGSRRLFDFAGVIENRLAAVSESDRTPDDAEKGRLQARIDLLSEQIEHQRIRNKRARSRYAEHELAEHALLTILASVGRILERIPAAILDHNSNLEPARKTAEAQTAKAIAALRAAVIEKPSGDTGSPESYT